MGKFNLSLLGFLLCGHLMAQLNIGVGYELDGFETAGMNDYIQSYNQYFGSSAKEPLQEFGAFDMRGFQGVLMYRYWAQHWVMSAGFNYGKSKHSFNSMVAGNFGQEHHFAFKDFNVLFAAGPRIGRHLFMDGILNFGFRNATMDVLTVFPDGSKSQGFEFDINGVYTTTLPSYEAGLGLGVRLGRITLSGRVTKSFNFLGSDGTTETGTVLTDFDANRYRSNSFPRDFEVWLNDPLGAQQDNAIFSSELKGLRINFGVEISIFKPKTNE